MVETTLDPVTYPGPIDGYHSMAPRRTQRMARDPAGKVLGVKTNPRTQTTTTNDQALTREQSVPTRQRPKTIPLPKTNLVMTQEIPALTVATRCQTCPLLPETAARTLPPRVRAVMRTQVTVRVIATRLLAALALAALAALMVTVDTRKGSVGLRKCLRPT